MGLNRKIGLLLAGLVVFLFLKGPSFVSANSVLGPEVTNYINSRSGTVSVGVYDGKTGETFTYNPYKSYYTMSIVKTAMLANVLNDKIPITERQNSLLTKMIANSNNSAANTVWLQLGSDRGVQSFFNQIGMTGTKAGTGGWWGHTTTNVSDQLTLMKHFAYPNTVLTDAQRAYGLNLMRNVQSDQRWGVSYGVPSGVSVALKNGWFTTGQYVNSIGYIEGQGKSYIIAVLTANNKSFSDGIDTISTISKMVWNNIPKNGWAVSNGKWYYFIKNVKHTGWLHYNGYWYYLDSTGAMKTGWVKYNDSWYYLNNDGTMKTGWLKSGGEWYFFDHSGVMKTGWVKSSSKWYYFNSDGKMKTGWLKNDGHWFYLMPSGNMRTGWTLYQDEWFFLNSSGIMETGWLTLSENQYYLQESGEMVTNWKQIDNKWHYFSHEGKMAANTTIGGYKIGADGAWIQVRYVALGDSLASGMTPQGQDRAPVDGIDPDWGYPNYIAKNFAKSYQLLKFINYGVSSYTTDNLLSDLGKETVQQEIRNATHLTIDIGINDLLPLLQKDQEQALNDIPVITDKVGMILDTINQLNPKAKVYVMGYYNPFPDMTDSQQMEKLNQMLKAFNDQIQLHAEQQGYTFVPTSHIINADYLPNPDQIHLSLTGYQAVAEEFWKTMQ